MSGTPPPPPPGSPSPPPASPAGRLDLGAAYRFAWDAFRPNAVPIVVVLLVLILVNVGANLVWQSLVDAVVGDGLGAGLLLGFVLSLLGSLVSLVVGVFIQAVYVRGGIDLVDGIELDLGRLVRPEGVVPLAVTSVLVGLGTTVGLVLCVLPGLVFGFLSSFAIQFVVDDGLAPVDAIRASIDLVRENVGNALLLWVVTYAVAFAGVLLCGVGVLVTGPVAFIAMVHGYRQLRGGHAPAA